jgi:hypothetical protein
MSGTQTLSLLDIALDGARTYLRLLAISQSCRFQEKSFLQFLLSGVKDVDAFKGTGRGKALPWKGARFTVKRSSYRLSSRPMNHCAWWTSPPGRSIAS